MVPQREEIKVDHSLKDPEVAKVETVNQPPCSLVTSVSEPHKILLDLSSPNVATLEMLELLWEMTVEPKVLPTLSLKAMKLPRLPLI